MTPVIDIIRSVSASTGRDHTELPPLNDVVDPDALQRFIESAGPEAQLQFEYSAHLVTVDGSGLVETEQLASASPTS